MRPIRLCTLVAAMLVIAVSVGAQSTMIRAGHLIDPSTGKVTADQAILVEGGTITAVGTDVEAPKGTRVIDLSSSWVLPGLMDAHVHITFGQPPPLDFGEMYLTEGSGLRALRGLRYARQILDAGFTTVRDAGNEANYASVDLRKAFERGWFTGPTVVTMGKIIAPFGGQLAGSPPEAGPFWHFEYVDADTPDEMRKAVRRNIYYGAQAIKLVCDNNAYHCTEAEVRAAVEEAHAAGLPVSVHVMGGEAARKVILGGADSIEHGFMLSDELLQLMKDEGTVLVGTDFPQDHLDTLLPPGNPWGFDAGEFGAAIVDRLGRAHRLGVTMAFGTDCVADLPGRTRPDMMLDYVDLWASAGITPRDTLKAMTTTAAELLRVKDARGAIAMGQAADIIATPENPLERIQTLREVQFVMKDGHVVRAPE